MQYFLLCCKYSNEREEAERLELKRMLSEDDVRMHKDNSKSQVNHNV